MALGGYFLFTVSLNIFSDPIPSFLLSFVISAALGFLVYLFLMKYMAGESVIAAVLVTIALGILLRGLITLTWTSQLWYPLQKIRMLPSNRKRAVVSTLAQNCKTTLLYLFFLLNLPNGDREVGWGNFCLPPREG
jgi:branched-subunit amino acid ABC-type transport system permease component